MWITSIVMLITSHMSIFTTQAHHLKDDISLLVLFIRNKLVSRIIVQRDCIEKICCLVIQMELEVENTREHEQNKRAEQCSFPADNSRKNGDFSTFSVWNCKKPTC